MLLNVPECPENPTVAGCTLLELHVLCRGAVGSRSGGSGQSNCFGCGVTLRAAPVPLCSS